jgi:hypothetical protein
MIPDRPAFREPPPDNEIESRFTSLDKSNRLFLSAVKAGLRYAPRVLRPAQSSTDFRVSKDSGNLIPAQAGR